MAKKESMGKLFFMALGIAMFILIFVSQLGNVAGLIGAQGLKSVNFVRQDLVVGVLKGFTSTPGLGTLGDLGITAIQSIIGRIMPEAPAYEETVSALKKCDFNTGECDLEKVKESNSIPDQNNFFAINIDGKDYVVQEGKHYFLPDKDLFIRYEEGNSPVVYDEIPTIFKDVYKEIQRCYDSVYMSKEGDPFYKSKEPNPYLCSRIKINLTEDAPTLTLGDLHAFINSTINPDTQQTFGANIKPLQLSYCFNTDTCARTVGLIFTSGGEPIGKTCMPIDALVRDFSIEQGTNINDIISNTISGALAGAGIGGTAGIVLGPGVVVLGAAGGAGGALAGFVSGSIKMIFNTEEISCDTAKMYDDLINTPINNAQIKIYYWDDNGETKQKLGNKPFRAVQLKGCSGAFVMSSKYFDYLDRQVDPLIICVEDETGSIQSGASGGAH